MHDHGSAATPQGPLREHAIRCAESGEPLDLATVWQSLTTARTRIFDAFHTGERCFLVLTTTPNDARPPLRDRNAEVLQRLLTGTGAKVIALELDASESSISTLLKQSARQLGLEFRASNVPTLLMMAAYAARRGVRVEGQRASFDWGGQRMVVIASGRPDRVLAERVSAAEYAVAQLLVEGHPYSEIAARRGTSLRTVANQLSAVFKKLDVSGRSELMAALVSRAAPASTIDVAPCSRSG